MRSRLVLRRVGTPCVGLAVLGCAAAITSAAAAGSGGTFVPPRGGVPITDEMRLQAEQARTAYEAAQRRRATPDAAAERARSRTAYSGLGRADALALGRRELAEVFGHRAFEPVVLPEGARVERFVGDAGALIERGEERRLVESIGLPLTSTLGSGERAFLDLSLRPVGEGFAPVNPLVPLRISSRGVAELPEAGTTVALVGSEPQAEAGEIDGRVFVAGALTDTDMILAPAPRGVSFAFQVRSASAPQETRLAVELPAGASLSEGSGPAAGSVEVVGSDGDVTARVLPPQGWDADGEPLDVSYAVDRDQVVVRFPHRDRDLRYPLYVDPVFEHYGHYPYLDPWAGWGFYANANLWSSSLGDPSTWTTSSGQPLKIANLTGGRWYLQGEYGSYSWQNPQGYIAGIDGYYVSHNNSQVTCAYMGILAAGWAYWKPGTWSNCYPSPSAANAWPTVSNSSDKSYGDFPILQYYMTANGGRWSEGSLTAWGLRLWLDDNESPTISSVSNSTNGAWVGPNQQVTVQVTARDAGLGMRTFNLYDPPGATSYLKTGTGGVTTDQNQACSGVHNNRCPQGPVTGEITFNTNDLTSDGERTLTGGAFDALNKGAAYSTVVRADTSAPAVSLKGELANLSGSSIPPGIYQFIFSATDPLSGLASLQMQVDTGSGWTSVGSPTSLGGGDYGWNFDARPYARSDVERTVNVRVLARDQVGNASAPLVSVSVKPTRGDVITSLNWATNLYAYGTNDWRQEDLPESVYPNLKANYLSFIRNRFNAARCPGWDPAYSTTCPASAVATTYDPEVQAAAANGIQLHPVITDLTYALDSKPKRKNFALWAARLAARYGPCPNPSSIPRCSGATRGTFWRDNTSVAYRPILSWEVWNEPNGDGPYLQVADYVDLLAQTKQQIRATAVQPDARIVFGGLQTSSANVNYLTYLANALDAGASASIEAVGIHPYAETPADAETLVSDLRLVLALRGLTEVQIWPNEIGWSVEHPSTFDDNNRFTVSESTQGLYAADLLARLRAKRSDWRIGPIAWFSLRDAVKLPEELTHFGFRTGLVDTQYASSVFDGRNRPSFHEMRTVGYNASSLALPPKR